MEPTREVLIVVMTMALEHLRDIIRDVGDPNLDCEETYAVATSREDHRPPGSGPAVLHRRLDWVLPLETYL
jgi:hypothetical protein